MTRSTARNLLLIALTACLPALAMAEESVKLVVSDDLAECLDGVSNKDWLFTMLGLILGTGFMAFVGLQTLSRRLASDGHRQSSANMAGLGLGMFVGGSIAAGIMASRSCGAMSSPGYLGMAAAAIGLVTMIFAIATGRSN